MDFGYVRNKVSTQDLDQELAAFEKAGSERLVVDSAPGGPGQISTLKSVLTRLEPGDTLTVYSLSEVANSVPALVELVADLAGRGVRFRSLVEGLDTEGKQGAAIAAVFSLLSSFQASVSEHRKNLGLSGRKAGRPKALSEEAAEEMKKLISEGVPMGQVAERFHVSRATLYRYLDQ